MTAQELGGALWSKHPEMLLLQEVHLPAAEPFSIPCLQKPVQRGRWATASKCLLY